MKWNSLALSLMVAGAVVTFPSIGVSQSGRDSEAKKLWIEGVGLQDRGRLAEAEKKFREALIKYPKAERSDRTAYSLIDTLMKLKRLQEARSEINVFLKNYPHSDWAEDVGEFIVELGGIDTPAGAIWNSPDEVIIAQLQDDLMHGRKFTAFGPPEKVYDPRPLAPNADQKAVFLRRLIVMDPERGILNAKELLKADPSNPAVIPNLSVIALTNFPQRVPFLLSVWASPQSSPNVRNEAFFWYGRTNPDKDAVAKEIMTLLESRETEVLASDTLAGMTIPDHRAVLDKIVSSSRPNKFDLMKKIYQRGSDRLRTDLLMFVSKLEDPKAVPFLMDAAQNDKDSTVRRLAAQLLASRRDVDVGTFERALRSAPTAPPAPRMPTQPVRKLLPQTSGGSNFAPLAGSN
jgi:tetratricopeptide (TPR) repeat protein